MHNIRPTAAPLDHEQAWACGGPHFQCHKSFCITLGGISCRSPRNDHLQIGELVETSVDVVLDVPKRRLDDGPKRQREQFLQTVSRSTRSAGRGRWSRGRRRAHDPSICGLVP